jgi:hypothetical protein
MDWRFSQLIQRRALTGFGNQQQGTQAFPLSALGQAQTGTPGVFSVTALNPSQATDACGNTAVTPVNEIVTISGSGVHAGIGAGHCSRRYV